MHLIMSNYVCSYHAVICLASGRASGSKKQPGTSKGPAAPGQEGAPDTLKLDKDYDIVIMATPDDRTLVQRIQRMHL